VTDCTVTYVFSSHFCFRSLFSRVLELIRFMYETVIESVLFLSLSD